MLIMPENFKNKLESIIGTRASENHCVHAYNLHDFVLWLMAAFLVAMSNPEPRNKPEATKVPGERAEIPTKSPKLSDLTRKC